MVKKIENYYLEQVVGEGEYGKVYKATNERNNELVAIKVIKIEKFKMSPKLEECTINEIQTLSKIEANEHVVKFVQILKTVNNYYFVYEYCNGGTLERMIKNEGHFSEQKALLYYMDMLKAFRTLTRYNIMHRDIKPGNILLHNGVIKIADFGFCKPLNSARDLAQTMLGSPIYMAPEILKGEVYTIKADIWSLGVVLYEMLFGFCPFEEKSIAKLLTLLEEGTVTFPRNINNISLKTEDLLRKMLVKDHFKRISWDELFEYELNANNELVNKRDNNPRMSIEKKILEIKEVNGNAPQPYCFAKKPPASYDPEMKKTVSQNDSTVNYSQRSFIKSLLDCRNRLQTGTKLVAEVLEKSKTRLAINLSCHLMRKVKELADFLEQQVRKTEVDKENDKYETRKTSAVLKEEIQQIKEKCTVFEQESQKSIEDERKTIERYTEELCLGSHREGLSHILEVIDFLRSEVGFHPAENRQYQRQTKEQLADEFARKMKILALSQI